MTDLRDKLEAGETPTQEELVRLDLLLSLDSVIQTEEALEAGFQRDKEADDEFAKLLGYSG